MFKFLKDKLKGAISKFSKSVEEEAKVEEPIKEEKVLEEEKEIIKEEEKLEVEKPKESPIEQEVEEEVKEEEEKKLEKERIEKEKELEKVEQPEKKGFFSKLKEKIITTKISYEKFENLFSGLELTLMENNVAVEVIEKIKSDLTKNLVEQPIKRTKIEEMIRESLKNSIDDLFKVEEVNLLKKIKYEEKPFVIAFFGINGSGKTTTIAKIADLLKKNKISCVLAASDTFRAASIEQLQIHADKLGIKLIKHDYGSDPAAVAFDAVKHAKAKKIDVVLIDTAGRLHNQANLMEELKKIVKVAKPNLKLFVGESIAGNDCIEQAQKFNEIIGIDGIILTKADVDEKGGAAISVSYITKKPIIYLGVGQEHSDLKEFEPNTIIESLGLDT
jgi:fused signal recognition particle receptor